jgi:hypothetical protein
MAGTSPAMTESESYRFLFGAPFRATLRGIAQAGQEGVDAFEQRGGVLAEF